MADEKDDKPDNVFELQTRNAKPKGVFKLWHERVEASKINKMATDLIKQFMRIGIRIDTINVYWDDKGEFIARTKGAHFDRRIEDKKTPPNN